MLTPLRIAAVIALFAFPISAQGSGLGFTYADFAAIPLITTNGATIQMGNLLQMTPMTNYTGGSFYHDNRMAVVAGFDTIFTFQMIHPAAAAGADGLTFVIHDDVTGTAAQSVSYGGFLAYSGTNPISNSLVIEFDNWQNGEFSDTSNNEISIHTNGTGANSADEAFSLGSVTAPTAMCDGLVHTARIEYIPGTLNVYLDNLTMPALTVPYTFANGGMHVNTGVLVGGLTLNNNAYAYVGFTGATGGASINHEILGWSWTSTPGALPCFESQVGLGVGGPYDILTLDGSTGGYFRTVERFIYQPFSLEIAQPPNNPFPAPYLIFGAIGFPAASDATPTLLGTMCFPPSLLYAHPFFFMVADSLGNHPSALLSNAPPAPFSIPVAGGIAFPVRLSFHGFINEDNTSVLNSVPTNAIQLDILPALAPTITEIGPSTGTVGDTVTITGTGFLAGLSLDVAGTPVAPTSVTLTSVTYVNPVLSTCGVTVTLTNPDGQVVTGTHNPLIAITNTILNSGPAAGGANFVIQGSGFDATTVVSIGGALATVTSFTPANILVQTPPGAVGAATVIVGSPAGCTAITTYTYL